MVDGIGKRIKALRNEEGLTQQQLADALFISLSSIAMYETEKSQPSPEMIVTIAKFFKVTADYLLGLED